MALRHLSNEDREHIVRLFDVILEEGRIPEELGQYGEEVMDRAKHSLGFIQFLTGKGLTEIETINLDMAKKFTAKYGAPTWCYGCKTAKMPVNFYMNSRQTDSGWYCNDCAPEDYQKITRFERIHYLKAIMFDQKVVE